MNLPDTSVALVGAFSLGSFSRGILSCSRLRAIFFARVSPRVLRVCGSLKSPCSRTGPCVIRAEVVSNATKPIGVKLDIWRVPAHTVR